MDIQCIIQRNTQCNFLCLKFEILLTELYWGRIKHRRNIFIFETFFFEIFFNEDLK